MIDLVTLGKFEFHIDGRSVSFGKKINNSLKLFLLLINQKDEGISKSELLYQMFRSQDKNSDLTGNLRIVLYRLRKTLRELGVPCPDSSDYILTSQGRYYWNPDIPVQTDADVFEQSAFALKNTPPPVSNWIMA